MIRCMAEGSHLSLGGCVEEGPGGEGEVEAVHNAGDEDGLEVPAVGGGAGHHAVLGQRNHGAVVEHSQQHDQQRGEVPVATHCLLGGTRQQEGVQQLQQSVPVLQMVPNAC